MNDFTLRILLIDIALLIDSTYIVGFVLQFFLIRLFGLFCSFDGNRYGTRGRYSTIFIWGNWLFDDSIWYYLYQYEMSLNFKHL